MKRLYLITFLSLALLGTSCERDLDFDNPSEEEAGNMVINAVAVADTSFTVYLNRAYSIGKTPRLVSPDYDHAVFFQDDETTDYVSNIYYKNTVIRAAKVVAVVNGEQTYNLILDETNLGYTCSYIPKPGDHIVVTASVYNVESFDSTGGSVVPTQEVRAETTVPAKPKIEVLEHEVLAQNPYQDMNGLFGGTDTIMRLTCRISDLGGERYYRLRVRSERDADYSMVTSYDIETGSLISTTYKYYYMQDVYFSEDDLFRDMRLTTSIGGWATNFTTIFDNSLMKNGSYTFTIDSPKACNTSGYLRAIKKELSSEGPDVPPRVMVELQAISPELYKYMKSVELNRVNSDDSYAEPVQIYSNVKDGWGIFGALSYDRHFVEYGE